MGKITELITSNDGKTRSAKVKLATGNTVNRPLNLLYPLECDEKEKTNDTKINDKVEQREERPDDDLMQKDHINRRPPRKAALNARDRIFAQNLNDNEP